MNDSNLSLLLLYWPIFQETFDNIMGWAEEQRVKTTGQYVDTKVDFTTENLSAFSEIS